MGELALPVALLSVGASLSVDRLDVSPTTVGGVVALKTLLMPVVAWVVFSTATADPSTVRAGVAMLVRYIDYEGGDDRLASANVFATTLCSAATLSLVFWGLG